MSPDLVIVTAELTCDQLVQQIHAVQIVAYTIESALMEKRWWPVDFSSIQPINCRKEQL